MKKLICLLLCCGLLCGYRATILPAKAVNTDSAAITASNAQFAPDDVVNVIVETELPLGADAGDYLTVKRQILSIDGAATFKYNYNVIFSGFSATVKYRYLTDIEALAAVKTVHLAATYEAAADTGSGTLDASAIELNANGMYDTDKLAWHGAGMLIGVIDTGIRIGHDAFSVAPPKAKINDEAAYGNILTSLKAYQSMRGLSAAMLYKSAKIAFAFDYADGDTDPQPYVSNDHGNHVAGIAAGNNGGTFKGSAYDAQLAVFKIFGDNAAGASDEACLAALEDAVAIGCDIVNMSLGQSLGWVTGSVLEEELLNRAAELGVTVIVAAGNDGTSKNNSALCPDSGTVSSMSTYSGALSIGNFDAAGNPASTSSWGCANDLSLKPDVVSNGTDVYSATLQSTKSYGFMSGTSMAAPNVAGATAVLKQALGNTYSGRELEEKIKDILMSTAKVMRNNGGTPYSPRLQGAGFVDLRAATGTEAIISVAGAEGAKLELGDDKQKTGVYKMRFQLVNLSAATVSYRFDGEVITEYYSSLQQLYFRPAALTADIKYFVEGKEAAGVTAAARTSVEIEVEITLSAQSRQYLQQFVNGMFVEGYIYLNGERATDLSVPFLGFYGDWSQGPIFDTLVNTGKKGIMGYSTLYGGTGSSITALGVAANGAASTRSEDQIAVPLTVNGQDFNVYMLNTYVLRSIRKYEVKVCDYDTGELIYEKAGGTVKKVYDKRISTDLTIDFTPAKYADTDTMANNSRYLISILGYLDDGDDIADDVLSIPLYIDKEAPVAIDAATESIDGSTYLYFSAYDNHYLQSYRLYYLKNDSYVAISATGYFAGGRAQTATAKIDITNAIIKLNGTVFIGLTDFAGNNRMVEYDLERGLTETPRPNTAYSGTASDKRFDDVFTEDGMTYARHAEGVYTLIKGRAGDVVVKEGTVRIAAYAFGALRLNSLTLPASLKRVGEGAFSGEVATLNCGGDAPALEYASENDLGYNNFASVKKLYRHFEAKGFDNWIYKSLITEQSYPNCTVSIKDEEGKEIYRLETIEGQEFVLPDVSKTGYEFKGFFTDSDCTVPYRSGLLRGNLNLYVKYELLGFKVSFVTDGGSDVEALTVSYGSAVRRPDDPKREGYRFIGWYLGDKLYDFDTPVTDNLELTAGWRENGVSCAACGSLSLTFIGPALLLGAAAFLAFKKKRKAFND